MKKIKTLIIILGLVVLGLPQITKAAILYLETPNKDYYLEDNFIVEIRVDSEGEYINVIEAELNFSSNILEIQDLSEGNSILSLWIKKPEFSNDKIYFAGGIPGGYQGSNGLIGRIAFKVRSADKNFAQVLFEKSSKVLLNDGNGSIAKLTTDGKIFNILPEKSENPENQWQKDLAEDKIFPQPFKIEISQNSLIFDGRNFITFSTTDKETGIDHYEIKEGKNNWERVFSPYVLKNQNLMGGISIKAVDKAGNYWIETIKLPKNQAWKQIIYSILIFLALILILVILKVVKRRVEPR